MRKLPPPPSELVWYNLSPLGPCAPKFHPFTLGLHILHIPLQACTVILSPPPLNISFHWNFAPQFASFIFSFINLFYFIWLAVSPLIMVRFEKFKIWHAQHFDANLLRVRDATCDVPRARDVTRDVINATISLLPLVVKQLLGRGYL